MMKFVFISAKLKANTVEEFEENIRYAEQLAAEVNDAGNGAISAICPHSLFVPIKDKMKLFQEVDDPYWYDSCIELMKRCDAVLFGYGWSM